MSKLKNLPISEQEMWDILVEQDTGVLCLADGNEPYGVPVSYAVIDEEIVFHCALKGRKLDILRKNPRVCFSVSRNPDKVKPHQPEGKCDYRFESVLCFGSARIIEDIQERFQWLCRFKEYFYSRIGIPADQDPLNVKAAEHCGCVVIKVETLTGRRKG